MEATVQNKQEISERIRRLGPELCALGVERLGLFGSFLRGQATQDSDVDILVSAPPAEAVRGQAARHRIRKVMAGPEAPRPLVVSKDYTRDSDGADVLSHSGGVEHRVLHLVPLDA